MKKTFFVLAVIFLVSAIFYMNPDKVKSSTAAAHIDVCASGHCFDDCLCLSCGFTLYLYDSTNTLVDSCTGGYPFSLCCSMTSSTHTAGNYHAVLVIPNCKTCTGDTFFFDGTNTATNTVDCSNCSSDRKTGNKETPKIYSLGRNYPNPFNPTTNISYVLPKSELVKLTVYDALGKVVSTLVNEFKEAGTYNVNFDASNLASGIYFYEIKAGNFSDIKKMLLIK